MIISSVVNRCTMYTCMHPCTVGTATHGEREKSLAKNTKVAPSTNNNFFCYKNHLKFCTFHGIKININSLMFLFEKLC